MAAASLQLPYRGNHLIDGGTSANALCPKLAASDPRAAWAFCCRCRCRCWAQKLLGLLLLLPLPLLLLQL